MLHPKYECCSPYGLSQEDFKRFPSLFPRKIGCALAEPKYEHRGTILTILIEDHKIILQTKYECSSHYGLSEEDFLNISFFVIMYAPLWFVIRRFLKIFSIFSHFVAMATRVFDGIKFF